MFGNISSASRTAWFSLAAALVLALAFPSWCAASWRVVPIRIDLDARNKTGSVKVINEGDTLLRFQLTASRWTQDEQAQDQYEETEELVFFPRILSIPPGEERMVRAGFKAPAAESEKTYRLFIEQIQEKTPASAAQVSILIRFGVPIFSAPLKSRAEGKMQNIRLDGQALKFDLANTGNVNLQVHSAAAVGLDAAGNEVFAESVRGWYLLNGHVREHAIPLPDEVCRRAEKIALTVQTDKVDLSRHIELGPERCGN